MLPLGVLVTCLNIPYWAHPRIHNFGNGRMHANIAPVATWIIDRLSYNGRNVRQEVMDTHILRVAKHATICDLCCGVGYSTASTPASVGVDTSPAMLDVARDLHANKTFVLANAELYGETRSFDVVTIMFALHEMPRTARVKILANAIRIARSKVIVCDISTQKTPSDLMLSGEPFLLEYQRHIKHDVANMAWANDRVSCMRLNDRFVEGHVLLAEFFLT